MISSVLISDILVLSFWLHWSPPWLFRHGEEVLGVPSHRIVEQRVWSYSIQFSCLQVVMSQYMYFVDNDDNVVTKRFTLLASCNINLNMTEIPFQLNMKSSSAVLSRISLFSSVTFNFRWALNFSISRDLVSGSNMHLLVEVNQAIYAWSLDNTDTHLILMMMMKTIIMTIFPATLTMLTHHSMVAALRTTLTTTDVVFVSPPTAMSGDEMPQYVLSTL